MSATNPIYQQDGLYNLLPAIYRNRDAELGFRLRALLRGIGLQAQQLSADIEQQYENWFIETCEDARVPYFAALVALDLGPTLPASEDRAAAGSDATWRRREVADAIADRRRKGTFSVLEQLAFDATGWQARAVEYGAELLQTRSLRFPGVGLRSLLDLHDGDALDVLGTPPATAAPLADVRSLSSHRTPGTGGPGEIAVWLWRLVADAIVQAPARIGAEPNRFSFDQLGRQAALAIAPTPRAVGKIPVLDLDVPAPITRAELARRIEDYYGPGLSLCVYRDGTPIPRSRIVVRDLAGWHAPAPGEVAIDPERGRIAFPSREEPDGSVTVSYSRLIVGPIGGGAYARTPAATPTGSGVYAVAAGAAGEAGAGAGLHTSIREALNAWREDREKPGGPAAAVIEIRDDGVYEEWLTIELYAGEQLVIRAAQGCRPALIPVDDREDYPDRLLVTGHPGAEPSKKPRRGDRKQAEPPTAASPAPSAGATVLAGSTAEPPLAELPRLTLDGIWIGGGPVDLRGQFGAVRITHSTLVPASGTTHLDADHDAKAASLVVKAMPCRISIASSVVGRIEVESPEAGHDPLPLHASDSVLDASRITGRAVSGADERRAFVSLGLERVTVLGGADVHDVSLVENSLVTGPLLCERRQTGRVRFSYFAPGSRTPRPTRCQPDTIRADVQATFERGEIPIGHLQRALAEATARVIPRFDARVFGEPAYARLALDNAEEILRGADDEGEPGVYHNLWQALGVADLRARLLEFSPAGIGIGIRFAS